MKQRSVVEVFLLTIITCGLYFWFWAYLTRSELKQYLRDESINPGLDVLLSIICFPYAYYWIFKYSKEVAAAEAKAGIVPTDNSLVNLLLYVFGLGIVSMMIIQAQLNEIARKQN